MIAKDYSVDELCIADAATVEQLICKYSSICIATLR